MENSATDHIWSSDKKISIPFIFLVLFTLTNFFSPVYMFKLDYAHLPFVLGCITIGAHIVFCLVKRKPIVNINSSLIYISIVLLFALYTLNNSFNPERSFDTLLEFFKAIILFILISNIIISLKEFKIFLFVLTISTCVNAYVFVNTPVYAGGRAYGSMLIANDPNGISALIIFTLPLAGALLLYSRSKLIKLLFIYVMFTMTLGIIEGQSRGGFLAIIPAVFMVVMLIPGTKKKIIYGLIALMLVGAFTLRYVPKSYIWRMQEIADTTRDGTGSARIRKEVMLIGLNYIRAHPISSYGIGNHSYLIAYNKGVSIANEEQIFTGSYLIHSAFLQIGADLGMIPMIFYLLFVASLFRYLRKSFNMVKDDSGDTRQIIIFSKALTVSLVGFLGAAFFLPLAYRLFLFYIAGLCIALHKLSQDHIGDDEKMAV